jgi:hypothetical protein
MNFKRADLALEVSGNTIYAIYGDEKGTIEAYDELNGKWIIVPFTFTDGMQPLKKVRGSVAIENNIYLLADEGIFEVINVNTRKILTGVKPPFTSSFYGITEFNRKIYVAAGANKDEFDYNVYLFNTLDNTWKSAGKISVDICGAGLVNHGRMLFFLGGSTTNMFQQTTPTGSIFIYRPMY